MFTGQVVADKVGKRYEVVSMEAQLDHDSLSRSLTGVEVGIGDALSVPFVASAARGTIAHVGVLRLS